MKYSRHSKFKLMAMGGCAAIALATAAHAQDRGRFEIAGGDLKAALQQFATQTDQEVLFSTDVVAGRKTKGISAEADAPTALAALLDGTGLSFRRTDTGTLLIVQAGEGGSPQADRAAGEVEALIVTAQKREEDIQDVPIAMSAFSQEDLTRSQIAGGPDLMTQVPNMTFTKTNFSSYSIQIRGIGTQAISATTDPAVAVAFNNTPFVRNRFFEQEFYDLQRIEVLRGPQGTLYGRNATAGVVNIISAKPKFTFEAKASGDLGNYANQRLEGMVNIPLVEDAVAIRLAGAWTKRDGYVTNQISGAPIDGRDLWSMRLSLRAAPVDAPFDVNLIWEHFEEKDDRLRSGKQLCHRHRPTSLTALDGTVLPFDLGFAGLGSAAAQFSQGCQAVSLYAPEAFETPNGFALPYYQSLQGLGFAGRDRNPNASGTQFADPYLSSTQSRDLRVIESTVDPEYSASSNIFELQASFDITEALSLTSETSYSTDELFSLQDLNRFNTTPGVFANSSAERVARYPNYNLLTPGPNGGGIFCDPQIGCSDRLVAMDLSTAHSTQFSEELRVSSDFEGAFNFSLGANFLRYDTVDRYYVFINTIALTALNNPFWEPVNPADHPPQYVPNVTDNRSCLTGGQGGWFPPDPGQVLPVPGCLYIDPNPIGSLNDEGHNYFLSKNPYKLISYAVFGEAYYQLTDNLKVTAGLRWTVDRKEAPRLPSMLLAANTIGLTVDEVLRQEWREPTGRLALDWKPDLSFTDETLLYASYAHGYKAGGANPPPTAIITYANVAAAGRLDNFAIFPRTFEPEFIDAFEVGSKNTLADGRVTLNIAAFYYDYKNYQVSEIVERSALNRNFDATVWGLELEADWRPLEALKLGFKSGYQRTRIADGEQAIDLMDRTAGDPNWTVIRPFPATPSSCVVPTWLLTWKNKIFNGVDDWGICTPIGNGVDPVTYLPYVPNPTVRRLPTASGATTSLFDAFNGTEFPANFWQGYPGYDPRSANNSQGIYKQLGGNELPNAPRLTATITADYTLPLPNDWTMTLHTDLHYQSESWWRVFNDLAYDKLKAYSTMNLAAILTNDEGGWNIMAYVKNVTDETALTGAFLFSDDTGLTTNVFLTEPRLYGLRVTKAWSGGPLLGTFGQRREGPYPFTLELGGQVQRHDAPYGTVQPSFASLFSSGIDPLDTQHQDLDWGDGGTVKLTYRPSDVWRVSAGLRVGKANGSTKSIKHEYADITCVAFQGPAFCQSLPQVVSGYRPSVDNYSDSRVRSKEEHEIVDFNIGRDFGLGALESLGIDSAFSAGLRYAHFDSAARVQIIGVPDWDLTAYKFPGYPTPYSSADSQHTQYNAQIEARREFAGTGPTLNWEAAVTLLGNDQTGRVTADLSLTGGILFGKQKTRLGGSEVANYYSTPFPYGNFVEPDSVTTTPVNVIRTQSVSAPLLDISLGFSYELDRVKLGAGYRWERYFDVLDGGYQDASSYDRTIDGPYVKLSVGFGG